jgi:hypothetical protein
MPLAENIDAEHSANGQVRRRFRIFLANVAIALGWALKRSCKGCAHRLFATARWLVPDVQRFLVYRPGDNHHWRIGTFLSRRQSHRVAAGFLIVMVLLGVLDLATRATAISMQSALGSSALQYKSLGESSETMQKFNSQAASFSATQSERVPLPTRKPQSVYEIPNEKGVNAVTKKRWLSKKVQGSGCAERHLVKAKHGACKGAIGIFTHNAAVTPIVCRDALGSAPALNVRLPTASHKAGQLVSLLRLSRLA